MFLETLKKTIENTKLLHRFIYENNEFFEDASKFDQKKYNDLQIGVLKKIANDKFAGDVNKFIRDPIAKKVMETYRDYVTTHLPFLMASNNNPEFDAHSPENINKAVGFILNKVFANSMAMSAKG